MKPRVLVDDELGVCRTFAHFLGRQDFIIQATETSARGIQRLRTQAFLAAFIAWELREEDGLDFIRMARRQNVPTRLAPITAYPDLESCAEFIGLGASYLTKQVRMNVVAPMVCDAVKHSSVRRTGHRRPPVSRGRPEDQRLQGHR